MKDNIQKNLKPPKTIRNKLVGMQLVATLVALFLLTLFFFYGNLKNVGFLTITLFLMIGLAGIWLKNKTLIISSGATVVLFIVIISAIYLNPETLDFSPFTDLSEWESLPFGEDEFIYFVFSIFFILFLELGMAISNFNKTSLIFARYRYEKEAESEKINLLFGKVFDSYFLRLPLLFALVFFSVIFASFLNEVISIGVSEQLNQSIEFGATYGNVLSIFFLFIIIWILRLLLPEATLEAEKVEKRARKKRGEKEAAEVHWEERGE